MCYQCSKCNRCGKFSYRGAILCNSCDAEVHPGEAACPACGASTLGNIHVGRVIYDPDAPVLHAGSLDRPKSPVELVKTSKPPARD